MKKVKIDKETEKKIEKGLKEIKEGKYVSFKELKKDFKKRERRKDA